MAGWPKSAGAASPDRSKTVCSLTSMVRTWGTPAAVRTGTAGWAAFREARETIGLNLCERGMDGQPPIEGRRQEAGEQAVRGHRSEKGDRTPRIVPFFGAHPRVLSPFSNSHFTRDSAGASILQDARILSSSQA